MKRFFVLLLVLLAIAAAVWFGLRGRGPKIALSVSSNSSSVAALLPKETLAFVHVPDVNGTRAAWHETDLYKLWREPAMQDFLQKPMTKAPKTEAVRQKMQELETLQIKDAFLAVLDWEKKDGKLVAGFRFKGSPAEAERILGGWRTRLTKDAPPVKRETVPYQNHQLEVMTHEGVTVATVYEGDWFYAANDLPSLQALLDRVDRRVTDSASTLAADENFLASSKHMPASYEVRAYGRFDKIFEKIAKNLPPEQTQSAQFQLIRQIKSFSAASKIEQGKFRDYTFTAMPQVAGVDKLTRESLGVAARDTFFYSASALNLQSSMNFPAGASLPPAMQRMLKAFSDKDITLETVKNTFGNELGLLGEWMENGRLPAFFATLTVKDGAKAEEIVTQIVNATEQKDAWKQTEKDGVKYFAQRPANPMLPFAPAIGLSPQRIVIGHDVTSMEGLFARSSAKSSALAGEEIFKKSEKLVGDAENAFFYFDTALFYKRLDAAVRPMLIMAAAFMPSAAETVDFGKLPAAETITKHLSPIVMSQRYDKDGYSSESVGPVSVYQAGLGFGAAAGLSAFVYQKQMHPIPASTPVISASPSANDDEQEAEDEPEEDASPTPR